MYHSTWNGVLSELLWIVNASLCLPNITFTIFSLLVAGTYNKKIVFSRIYAFNLVKQKQTYQTITLTFNIRKK